MIKAYSYLRVSGKAQVDGDGFPRQRAAIATFAASADIEIVREWVERAVPGKTEWEDRPTWLEMMLAMQGDGVETIVIESLNRLARDLMVQEHIIADLKKRGITLISVQEPDLCTDDPSRKLLRQIMGAIAEYDRAMIVLKLRGARNRMKAREGYCEGRKPYGDRPGEAEVLAKIVTWRSEGLTIEGITGRLNDQGIASRYNSDWSAGSVSRILRRVKAPKALRYKLCPDHHASLVGRDACTIGFEECQVRLARRAQRRKQKKHTMEAIQK